MSTALFIGRFQPFHLGHWSVVERALAENDFLIIGIGSAEQDYLPDNPFTARERWEMITAALDEQGVPKDRYTIIPVRNINHYGLWVDHVSKLVPSFEKVYTGSTIVKRLFEEHGKYFVVDVITTVFVSGTDVRNGLKTENQTCEKWLSKAVFEYLESIDASGRIQAIDPD